MAAVAPPIPDTAAAATPNSSLSPQESPGLYPVATFDLLASFKYIKTLPGESRKSPRVDPFPPAVKALDQKKVTVIGFMAPLDVDDEGRVLEFMLMRNQLFCCYGKPLDMNEWIEVTPAGDQTVEQRLDMPLAASGVLTVGERDIEGIVIRLYHLDLEDIRPVDGENARSRPLPK